MKNEFFKKPLFLSIQFFILSEIFVFIFPCLIEAQTQNLKFEHLSSENGLSQNSIQTISEDSKGFMWFGTYEGLNRYDGYEFKVYKSVLGNPKSLINNTVRIIYKDHRDVLWIGTDGGLDKYDREKDGFNHYKHDPNNPGSISSDRIRWMCEDQLGALWIGTFGGGLNQLDIERKRFVRYQNNPADLNSISSNDITCVYVSRSGNIWIATDNGLNKFIPEKNRFVRYKHDPRDPGSISGNDVYRIYEDQTGVLWFGIWNGGLDRFEPKKGKFIHYKSRPNDPNSLSNDIVRSFYEDRLGYLWIGTWGGGLNQFDREKDRFIRYVSNPNDPNSLSSNSILSMYEDRSGILWVGTDFGGINKCDRGKIKFAHFKNDPNNSNSLKTNTVYTILETAGRGKKTLWIGTHAGGLNKYEKEKNKFTHYLSDPDNPRSLIDNNVRIIVEDHTGKLWIGTNRGLNQFDPEKETFTYYTPDPSITGLSNNDVFSICEDRFGNIWVGTYGRGLYRYDTEKKKFTTYITDLENPNSLNDNYIWSILEDRAGILWIGTDNGGLNQYDREKNEFVHYTADPENPNSLSDNKILCIYEDRSGILWIGTTKGLNKYDRVNKRFVRFLETDGLPSNAIQSILEDEHGNLWIGTQKGLSKFDTRTYKCKTFKVTEGLQSNEFTVNACYKSSSGEMYFGGINGFNTFFPDKIKDNPYIPPVVITDFQIFNKSVPVGEEINNHIILKNSVTETKEIILSYKEDDFLFEFASLHYSSSMDNQYAYTMEGFDKGWNYTTADRRFAKYTNMSGGEYVFRVKGSNSSGVWNETGASIHIVIAAPFWKTWWFYCLSGIIIILIGVGVYKIRMLQVHLDEQKLQRKVDQRTFELALEIDEHKKTEEILKNERNLFRIIIDHLPDVIYVKDLEGRNTVANIAVVRIVGRQTEADLLGKTDYEFYPVSIAAGYMEEDKSIIKSGQPVIDREECFFEKDGKKHWLLTSKLPLRDEHGRIIGLVGIGHDITERKLAEDELRKSEAKMRLIFNNAFDGISIYEESLENRTRQLVECNQRYAEMAGRTKEELIKIGNTLEIQKSVGLEGRERNWMESPVGSKIEIPLEGLNFRGLFSWNRPDGKENTIEYNAVTINIDGKYFTIGLDHDLTERMKLQGELIQSQKMQSIGTLAGGIAHDFNNILGIILGCSSFIEKQNIADPKISENIAIINQTVHRGEALVRQILTFARKTDVAFKLTDVTGIVHEILSMLRRTFPGFITFIESYETDGSYISADRIQIHQAILNLCVNSRDAMPNGGVITIKVEKLTKTRVRERFSSADREAYICISVTDTGEGMGEATRIRAFDPFFTTKAIGKGTGMGLSVVYGVVQTHQGFIDLESELGQGATFRLYFPVAATNRKTEYSGIQGESFTIGGTETVLLVEDEEFLLKLVRTNLESRGYKVYVAKNGLEAVELYKKHQQEIALILSDLGLPGISGMDEFKRLKKNKSECQRNIYQRLF